MEDKSRLRLVLVLLVTWAVFAVAQTSEYVTHPTPQAFNCTVGLKDGDLFFHAHPNDSTKYIQCDQYGNAFIKSCPRGKVWNQSFLTCIPGQDNRL